MSSRFAEIKVSDNTVTRVIIMGDIINGVDVINNPGDTSVEIYLKNNVPQDSYVLSNNGGIYPDCYWKQSMNTDQVPAWRTKAANISDIWQENNQRFISQKDDDTPNSYVLNETSGLYEPPVAVPTAEKPDGAIASWNESLIRWEITLTDGTVKYWDPNTSIYIDN